jgi:hypothetical protein
VERLEHINTQGRNKIYMVHTHCDFCKKEIRGNHAKFKETWSHEYNGEQTWDICNDCAKPFNKLIRKSLTKCKK